jgi:hypothetical protein
MNYTKHIEKAERDLIGRGYSCFIGNEVLISISNNEYDRDYTLVIENNEGLSTLDTGSRDYIITSYYIAVCMSENGATFRTIEKAFDADNSRECFKGYLTRWLKKRELEAIKGHEVFLTRKSYYQDRKKEQRQYYMDNRERLLEWHKKYYQKHKKELKAYGKEYRMKQKAVSNNSSLAPAA